MKLLHRLGVLMGMAAATGAGAEQAAAPKNDHAVVVHFAYGSKDLTKLFALEDELEKAMLSAGAGELDGNEVNVDGSDGYLFMYGPHADRLFAVIKPILDKTPFMRGAQAQLRFGPPQSGAQEKTIVINP
ncbi:hypothetical protein [Rhodoferax sp. U11-2br]|uniref:hypothetical protein n=1 Tax=Rhodoferax sp. U11-2br TaxID=2838878 RepID=UPI001BE88599|nr:hypothetical protein [Rhodoferax sp. U11-2br]MBT3067698.1 hypothetical protein [Rhodoferax sp. U11-2br]